jgi:hypothetical protein
MRTLLAVAMAAFVFIPPEAEKVDVYGGCGCKRHISDRIVKIE